MFVESPVLGAHPCGAPQGVFAKHGNSFEFVVGFRWGGFARAEVAGCRGAFGLYGGGLARGCGGAYEIGVGGNFAGSDFADYGDGSFSGAVERACFDPGDFFDSGGCAAGASFDYLGGSGWMHLGGGEYVDDFCDSRCGIEHCLSFVEFE